MRKDRTWITFTAGFGFVETQLDSMGTVVVLLRAHNQSYMILLGSSLAWLSFAKEN